MGLVLLMVYVVLALIWRSALHRRRDGDSGSRLAATTATGKLAAAAMTAAHGLALLGVLAQGDNPVAVVAAASVVIFAAGLLVVISAQTTMGASWRVGVDPNEHTALVTRGLFRTVRNPIFTGMTLCLTAIASSSMSWIAATAVAVFIAGAEVQVRLVEEPYLQRVHGPSFSAYMRHTGRFVPRPATAARDRLAT